MATAATRQRHATFILQRFAITAVVLALAPFFLAFRGAPTGAETLVFACAFVPLAAAVLLARTGRLGWAHAVGVAGLVGLALTLWLALGCGAPCALAWLVAAQLEASLARETHVPIWAAVANGGLALLILSASPDGDRAMTADTAVSSAFVALALAYAVVVSASLCRAGAMPAARPAETFSWLAHPELIGGLVVGLDARGSVTQASGDATIGLMPDALSGRGLFEHVHVADRPAFLQTIDDAAQRADTIVARIRIRRRARPDDACEPGSHIWVEMRATRLAGASAPGAAAVVAVLRAVAAPPAVAPPTAAPPVPDDIGHELRTPLNAIVGFSEMLASRTLRPTDADKQFEYARIVHQSGQQLLGVVNAMLDASRPKTPPREAKPFDLLPSIPPAVRPDTQRMKQIA